MSLYHISSSLLSLTLFIEICNGETSVRTNVRCDLNNCKSYTSSNSSWLLPDGNGCKDNVNGIDICAMCPNENDECECVSNNSDLICAVQTIIFKVIDGDISEGTAGDPTASSVHSDGVNLPKQTIILIIVGGIFGICCIVYYVCGGAVFISEINKHRRNSANSRTTGTNHHQIPLV